MRLLTRSDFDGLVCAVLLTSIGIVHSREFVHQKDIQDGLINVTENDVLANVPFVEGCGLWFDHHSSEEERFSDVPIGFQGAFELADSAARVIFNYYGGEEKFGTRFDELLNAVDRSDSAKFTKDEILNPKGGVLLSFIMDARTGLGRYKDYRISNYQLMDDLIHYCQTMKIEEILNLADVKERVDRYFNDMPKFEKLLKDISVVDANVLITDLRNVDVPPAGNRFLLYTLFPKINISIRAFKGKMGNVVFAVGSNIFNQNKNTDIGALMLKYGGGRHRKAGTCQVETQNADKILKELIEVCKANG